MNVASYGDVRGLDGILLNPEPQIVLLDVNLAGESGYIAAARLRARPSIGIVMLTAHGDCDGRLLAFSIGVDHYLSKAVDLRELESILRNLARRVGEGGNGAASTDAMRPAAPHSGAQWTLDAISWQLAAPNGTVIELSSAEYQLLLPLLESPGQPGSRDMINARLGKPRLDSGNRSLDVLVSRVRRKIEDGTGIALPLRAARGSGYVFAGKARVTGSESRVA